MDRGLIPPQIHSTSPRSNIAFRDLYPSQVSQLQPTNPPLYQDFIGTNIWNAYDLEVARGNHTDTLAPSAPLAQPQSRLLLPETLDGQLFQGQPGQDAAQDRWPAFPHSRKRLGSLQQNERLGNKRPNSTTNTASMDGPAGATRSNPIDLSSPPRNRRPQITTSTSGRYSSSSSIVLPRWQPDDEAPHCPVCETPFGLLYRRHHCRKCGKVVCASCSPHRITIPRQFIVNPPTTSGSSPLRSLGASIDTNQLGNLAAPTQQTPSGPERGQVVRVCNPCVPDPNFSPPPQSASPVLSANTSPGATGHPNQMYRQQNFAATTDRRPPGHPQPLAPSRLAGMPYSSQYQPTRRPHPTMTFEQSSPSIQGYRAPHTPNVHQYQNFPDHRFPALAGLNYDHTRRSSVSSTINRYPTPRAFLEAVEQSQISRAGGNAADNARSCHESQFQRLHSPRGSRSLSQGQHATSNTQPPQRSAQPAIQRTVAEEDECPVCSIELPPKGPDGNETQRTQHVEHCLRLYSAGSLPTGSATSGNPGSVPTLTTSTSAPSAPSTLQPSLSSYEAQGSGASAFPPFFESGQGRASPAFAVVQHEIQPSITQARRMTGGRMLTYRASEKDCISEDGQAQECIICFEEFAVGEDMGRLECLCKFHKACIRSWWETKGPGSCPTHQLHQ